MNLIVGLQFSPEVALQVGPFGNNRDRSLRLSVVLVLASPVFVGTTGAPSRRCSHWGFNECARRPHHRYPHLAAMPHEPAGMDGIPIARKGKMSSQRTHFKKGVASVRAREKHAGGQCESAVQNVAAVGAPGKVRKSMEEVGGAIDAGSVELEQRGAVPPSSVIVGICQAALMTQLSRWH
jgi:hypothetical protein